MNLADGRIQDRHTKINYISINIAINSVPQILKYSIAYNYKTRNIYVFI